MIYRGAYGSIRYYFFLKKDTHRAYLFLILTLSIVVILQSFCRTDSDAFSMTERTLIEILAHLLSDFLRFELDRYYRLPAISTEKSDFSPFWIEVIFTFLPE
jgi:hypothetical protein